MKYWKEKYKKRRLTKATRVDEKLLDMLLVTGVKEEKKSKRKKKKGAAAKKTTRRRNANLYSKNTNLILMHPKLEKKEKYTIFINYNNSFIHTYSNR